MPDAIDAIVRTAAIERVRELSERYAHRIPLSALMDGVLVEGQRVPLLNPQRGIFKPEALGRSGAALTIQTSLKSPYDDSFDWDAAVISYSYQGNDPSARDNVALRNAMLTQVPIIYLVAVDAGVYDAFLPVFVIGDEPSALRFTMAADQLGAMAYDGDPASVRIRREYATRTVLQRRHQQHFRRMVLAAYRNQCSICRLKHVDLLDAAHILSDKHPKGEPVIPNGLGLCKIHHAAFDANIIGVDPEARVHLREDILHEKDGPMLLHGLQEMAGTRLVLPRKSALHPNPDFLAERFDQFRAA